jgi:hypothetical protein
VCVFGLCYPIGAVSGSIAGNVTVFSLLFMSPTYLFAQVASLVGTVPRVIYRASVCVFRPLDHRVHRSSCLGVLMMMNPIMGRMIGGMTLGTGPIGVGQRAGAGTGSTTGSAFPSILGQPSPKYRHPCVPFFGFWFPCPSGTSCTCKGQGSAARGHEAR